MISNPSLQCPLLWALLHQHHHRYLFRHPVFHVLVNDHTPHIRLLSHVCYSELVFVYNPQLLNYVLITFTFFMSTYTTNPFHHHYYLHRLSIPSHPLSFHRSQSIPFTSYMSLLTTSVIIHYWYPHSQLLSFSLYVSPHLALHCSLSRFSPTKLHMWPVHCSFFPS